MNRLLLSVFFLLLATVAKAQNTSEEIEVEKTIETFFEGFHARDSIKMKSVLSDAIVVQTIGRSKTGEMVVMQNDIQNVLKGIVSIPSEMTFKETLHSFDIKVDGEMANAWTPYSFHMNETFSHCGVNNFQLFKENGEWEIIYLIDTRRKEGCELNKQ